MSVKPTIVGGVILISAYWGFTEYSTHLKSQHFDKQYAFMTSGLHKALGEKYSKSFLDETNKRCYDGRYALFGGGADPGCNMSFIYSPDSPPMLEDFNFDAYNNEIDSAARAYIQYLANNGWVQARGVHNEVIDTRSANGYKYVARYVDTNEAGGACFITVFSEKKDTSLIGSLEIRGYCSYGTN